MDIQYLGHSCFIIASNGKKVIIDPFITENPLTNMDPSKYKIQFYQANRGLIPVLYVESVPPDSGNFDWQGFLL